MASLITILHTVYIHVHHTLVKKQHFPNSASYMYIENDTVLPKEMDKNCNNYEYM